MKKDWEIKSFEDCIENVKYTTKIPSKDYRQEGEYPIVSQEEELISGYWDNENDLFKLTKPVVIFGDHTRVLKYVDFDFVLGADGVKILQPNDFLNAKFFLYFLMNANIKNLGYARHYRLLKELNIPVPPLEEQKRIVKILDEKFAQLESLKANAQTNLQNAKDLFQSQLAKAFSNTTWEKKRLGDLCSKIGSGATPKGGRDSYKSEGIHLVRSMNVYDSKFVYDELACIDDKQAYELRNVELQENDVLFNITGASVCRCCVLPSEVLPARVNQHVSILRPKQEQLNPTFLCSAMLGYKEILYKIACVGGSTRQAITKSQLEDFEIPLPPLPEQKRIVKEFDTLSEKVRQLQEIYTKQIANCDELKQAYLQKAFEGEL